MSNYDWFDGPPPETVQEKLDKRVTSLEEKVDKINESLKPTTSALNVSYYEERIINLETENEMLASENQRLLAIIRSARDELDE